MEFFEIRVLRKISSPAALACRIRGSSDKKDVTDPGRAITDGNAPFSPAISACIATRSTTQFTVD